jgi:hypothetical protein
MCFLIILCCSAASSQTVIKFDPSKDLTKLSPLNVSLASVKYKGKRALKVTEILNTSGEQFVKIKDLNFKNGIIETEIVGTVAPGAFEGARGFVGIGFRIGDDNQTMECFYLRPTNGRATDQVRRNHSVQYTSSPDYPWQRLRRENPEKYEAYVDLLPGEWTKIKIVVTDNKATLFVHGAEQPTLIVNDLKLGADAEGAIGLWIGLGTEAYFSKLTITKFDK